MTEWREVWHFYTKVAGVTRDNRDGSNRQAILARCWNLEPLVLDHEEDNPKDAFAVRVLRSNGEQLGYLNAELAEKVVRKSKKGHTYTVFLKEITGGRGAKKTLGANLLVIMAQPGVTDAEAQAYINTIDLKSSRAGATKDKEASCLTVAIGLAAMIFVALMVICLFF